MGTRVRDDLTADRADALAVRSFVRAEAGEFVAVLGARAEGLAAELARLRPTWSLTTEEAGLERCRAAVLADGDTVAGGVGDRLAPGADLVMLAAAVPRSLPHGLTALAELHRVRGAGYVELAPALRFLADACLVHARKPGVTSRAEVPARTFPGLERKVSAVVPCRNEAKNLAPLVAGLVRLYRPLLAEIVLVDDASDDGTRAELERLAAEEPLVRPVFRRPPPGVGRALCDGYRASSGSYVLSLDADVTGTLPELSDLFEEASRGADVVVGSRFVPGGVVTGYPAPKLLANRAFHALARALVREGVSDVTNNLKLFRRETLERLRLHEPGFAANGETGLQPLLLGCDVREVPVSWHGRTAGMGRSSFRLARVGLGYARVLARAAAARAFGLGGYGPLAEIGRTVARTSS